ncbi:MAG: PA14 domain-containing protein [Tepidisphaeraceae bacterium]
MIGGKFQASNDPNFASGVVDLYTITSTPPTGVYTDIAIGAGSAVNGLSANYYNSLDLSGTPVPRIDSTVDFDWTTGSPGTGINADQFSARWTGQVQTVEAGTYTFSVTADDGVRLWVNDTLLIDKWVDQSATTYTATITLTAASRVNLRMEYYEKTGNAVAKLGWRRPGQTATSAIPTGNLWSAASVPAGATYRYVRYLSPAGGYANIAEAEFYTSQVLTAPAAPSGLTATAVGTAINLTWVDQSTNETAFVVERRQGTSGTWAELTTLPAGSTNFSDGTVVAATTYDYRVKSRNSVGDSAYSNIASATSNGTVVVAPSAPTTLTASTPSSTSVSLSWTDTSTNETQFIIERAPGTSGGTFAQVGFVGANITTFTDTTASAGTTYRYRVYASNSAGPSGYSNVVTATTPAGSTTPAAPSSFAAQLLSGPQVKLTWTDNSTNETGFKIERRYAGWIWEAATTVAANAVTYTDTNVIGGVVYEYRISATNAAGSSAVVEGLIVDTSGSPQAPAAPTGLTATAATGTRVDLAWDDNSTNETGFKVERRLVGGTFAQIGTVAANVKTYADTTVTAGNSYEYRVRATTGSLDSSYSGTASVTTPGGTGGVPAAPSGVTLQLVSTSAGPNVRVNWTDNSNNETGFRIQRRYAGWIWEDLANVGANTATYLDTTSIGGVVYEYRVLALGSSGNSPTSAGVEIAT